MNKARETVLKLVAEGKISVEEAEELLDAIEGGSGETSDDFFSAKRAKAGAHARARAEKARRSGRDKRYEYGYDFKFNFPWEQSDWQWPWEQPDWQWPWEKPGGTKNASVFEVPEEAQLKIRNDGGDLIIRSTKEESLRITDPRAASKVAVEDKVVHISSTGVALAIEVPAKVVSMEVAQSNGNMDMHVKNLRADLAAKVADGNISISRATGKIQASVEGGEISLVDIRSTEIGVQTDVGDIFLKMLPTVKDGSVSLSTDSGSISLVLPPDSQCQILANTPDGNISHSLSPRLVEISDETDTYLNAKLNGGGADFVLSTKTGDIAIKA